jgi:hypothetical protein
MTKETEALKLALEALEKSWNPVIPSAERETNAKEAIAAVKEALAQPAQENYDQTALELCNVCGWKTLIPDDGCLNCERAKPAQPGYRLVPLVPTDAMQVFVHKQAWINAVNAAPLPVQEPVAYIDVEQRRLQWAKPMSWNTPTTVNLPKIPLYTAPPAAQPEERNFCPRCGKRTADLTTIHTCTPPVAANL